MGIDTKIILILCIITEILMKTRFSVMAALICILRGLPKGARVASFRFLKSTPQWYRNSKNTLYGLQCTLIGPCHRTIVTCPTYPEKFICETCYCTVCATLGCNYHTAFSSTAAKNFRISRYKSTRWYNE